MKRRLLRLMRLSERPDPPPGSDESLLVFRASPRVFQLKVAGWVVKQAFALLGILISFAVLGAIDASGQPQGLADQILRHLVPPEGREIQQRILAVNREVAVYLRAFEYLALALFGANLVLSWVLLRLDWEARWYMVSDESLRIREGLWRTHERTMTVANIQNLRIRRNPVQKLLGIADLEVQTAGGGAGSGTRNRLEGGGQRDDLHVGRFRGIDDAESLRDRIQAAMLRHRGSGLGDPDERHEEVASPAAARPASLGGGALAAACDELVREARELRAAVARRQRTSSAGGRAS